jgi:hypothetical protein
MARTLLTQWDIPQQADPPNPATGFVRVYAGIDGKLYARDPAGLEYDLTAVGAGDGGAAPVAVTYRGRASTPITPGRAGTANQPIMAFWNGSASKIARITAMGVALYQTVIKAVTVPPPIIRFYRTATAPVNGVAISKVSIDTALSSDLNISIKGDASADRTSGASALAQTTTGGALTQECAPRMITAAGYEMFDRDIFFDLDDVVCRPNEGLLMRLDYNLATSNPITDMWIASLIWTEE